MKTTAPRKGAPDIPSERRTGTRRRVVPERTPLVLLADDCEDNRALYASYFEYLEMRIEHAVDGEHALLKILQHRPDAVVMDLAMPVLDGWEAIREMKAHPRMKSIPVIALTGQATDENIRRATDAGADAVLEKPCEPAVLHAVLRDFLDRALRDD